MLILIPVGGDGGAATRGSRPPQMSLPVQAASQPGPRTRTFDIARAAQPGRCGDLPALATVNA